MDHFEVDGKCQLRLLQYQFDFNSRTTQGLIDHLEVDRMYVEAPLDHWGRDIMTTVGLIDRWGKPIQALLRV